MKRATIRVKSLLSLMNQQRSKKNRVRERWRCLRALTRLLQETTGCLADELSIGDVSFGPTAVGSITAAGLIAIAVGARRMQCD